MSSTRSLLYGLALLLLPAVVGAQEAAHPADSTSAPVHTLAVADFTGSDPDLGRFIAETLLTDLAQSPKMHFAERSEIRRAIEELKLQSTGLVEPQQVKQLGSLVSADRIIVGSYFQLDNQIIINARLLDVETGKLMEGGASNVTGDKVHLLSIVHRLAHEFYHRVTGEDFVIQNEGAEPATTRSLPANGSASGKSSPTNSPHTYRPLHSSSTLNPPQRSTAPSDSSGYHVQEQSPVQPQSVDISNTQTPSDPPPPRIYQPIIIQESSLLYPVNYPGFTYPVIRVGYATRGVGPYRIHFAQPRIYAPNIPIRRRLR